MGVESSEAQSWRPVLTAGLVDIVPRRNQHTMYGESSHCWPSGDCA